MQSEERRTSPAHGAATGGPGVDDDEPVGRVLSRREVLLLLGGGTAALTLAACVPVAVGPTATAMPGSTAPTATAPVAIATTATESLALCVVRPAMTEGPYFVDEMLNRSDIRTDDFDGSAVEGVALNLAFRVQQIDGTGCTPLPGVQVDVWHCDGVGNYSDVANMTGHNFLRGFQLTDERGLAEFTSIYPGWYPGRAVHIHYKIRTDPASTLGYEFTSQLFFPEEINDLAHAQQPYASMGRRNRLNEDDSIFRAGDQSVLSLTEENGGFSTLFDIALDLADAQSV